VVKQELGTELQSGERQEIDDAKNFEEVKIARNSIGQRSQKPYSPISPPKDKNSPRAPSSTEPKNNGTDGKKNDPKNDSKGQKSNLGHSNLTSRIMTRASIIIGGSIILVLIGIIIKKLRTKKKKS
jgi:hypothetical protein